MMRVLSAIAFAASLLACASASEREPEIRASGEHGHVVYLNFADGTEGVRLGTDDDAASNTSRLCATRAFAAWAGAEGCGDRNACREELRARVAEYYARYDVTFVTTRPPRGSVYTMVVVAPPNEDCTFGERGVSYADCGDANPASVAFVFDCDRSVDECAVLIAHETAHTFGLVHVTSDEDIMTPAPIDPALRFSEAELPAPQGACGLTSQSSHTALLAALGASRAQPTE